jgi:hypothetical protein
MDIFIAVVLAVILSILISIIQVKSSCGSKVSYRACVPTGSFLLYLLILIIGNTATTLLAGATMGPLTQNLNPSEPTDQNINGNSPVIAAFSGLTWFWYAFVGVFGFEILLKNMNLTFANRDILSINDWITKARDNAVESALEMQINLDEQESQRLANHLVKLSVKKLDTHIVNTLGQSVLHRLQTTARKQKVDVKLIKALYLAKQEPVKAIAIISAKHR